LREGLPTLASRGGTFRSLRRGDPSKSSPRQQRVRIAASFCLPAVSVRPPHPPPTASFRRRSQGKGLSLALPHPGRLQAGGRGGVRKPASASRGRIPAPGPDCSPKRAGWRAGDCHRVRPAEAGVPWWGSPLGTGRSRFRLGAGRSWFRGGRGRSRCQGVTGDAVRGSRSCEGHRGRVAGSAEAGLVPATVERVASHRPTSQAKATRGAPEGMPEPEDRLPGPR
jgi:hypothetical protein